MILILGVIFLLALIMLIAGLVEGVKGLWITALVFMGLIVLATLFMFFGIVVKAV